MQLEKDLKMRLLVGKATEWTGMVKADTCSCRFTKLEFFE